MFLDTGKVKEIFRILICAIVKGSIATHSVI